MDEFPYIADFYDAAASADFADLRRSPDPNMPVEMHDPKSIDSGDGWIGWRLIPSTVTDLELDELESTFGITYPPIYRAFLKIYHHYDLPSFGVRFSRNIIHRWKKDFEQDYTAYATVLEQGLLPIGEETFMDAGAVCFDTRHPSPDGDCPVVFWDHEWVGTEREIRPLFSSGELMFASLAFALYADGDFAYHNSEEDDPARLPLKKKKMNVFLDIDPEGAGGVAREYWTTWGVNPDVD